MNPQNFKISTDFATLKNDTQTNTLSLTINSGTVYNNSSPLLGTVSMDIGTINAGIRARCKTSLYTPWIIGPSLLSTSLVSIPSMPAVPQFEQWIIATLERTSPTTVTLTVSAEGAGGGGPNFRLEQTQTITFVFSTFLSPFN